MNAALAFLPLFHTRGVGGCGAIISFRLSSVLHLLLMIQSKEIARNVMC
jgi:hypothetical protein